MSDFGSSIFSTIQSAIERGVTPPLSLLRAVFINAKRLQQDERSTLEHEMQQIERLAQEAFIELENRYTQRDFSDVGVIRQDRHLGGEK